MSAPLLASKSARNNIAALKEANVNAASADTSPDLEAALAGMFRWNKPPLKRGKVGSHFLMRETARRYSFCTSFK